MTIYSEIAPLKTVILHKPIESISRLTPSNCHDYLFDDVLWPEKAGKEHDIFSETLRDHGVEVLFLEKLLEESLMTSEARQYFIQQHIARSFAHIKEGELLGQYLSHLSAKELVSLVLKGMTYGDLGGFSLGLCSRTADPTDFIFPPLPNHLFMRDSSFWLGDGVSINSMAFGARRPESVNMATIYRYHPRFKGINYWYDSVNSDTQLPSIEGGDVLVISRDCVLIGLGERTQPQAVELLAKRLFRYNTITQVIAIALPKKRAYMHLDTLMTMVNYDTFCVAFPCETEIHGWKIMAGDSDDELVIQDVKNIFDCIAHALHLSSLNLIHPGGDQFAREREQWTDSSNLLAIKPGMVIAYECNTNALATLRRENIDVLTIPGSELGRGRGGSRCMSCPVHRE